MATRIIFCLFLVFINFPETTTQAARCKEFITMDFAGTCFHLKFSCPYTCSFSSWPDYKDYYKSSECKDCECSYCYIGDTGGSKEFLVKMGLFDYKWQVKLAGVVKKATTITIPRADLVPTFEALKHFKHTDFAPVPWGGILQTHYDRSDSTFHQKNGKTLPPNGQFRIFARDPEWGYAIKLYQYDVTWFTPLLCSVGTLSWVDRNDPLLSVDCDNKVQWPIVYSASPSLFEMRNNNLYLKDLTINGDFSVTLTAMFKGIDQSKYTKTVNLEVGQIYITDVTQVKESKDRYIFTCITNNTYNDLTYEWFWNKVQITKGLSQSMQDGKSIGILDFDGLSGKVTRTLSCSAKRRPYYIPATWFGLVCTECFPEVELTTTSLTIVNGMPVEVSCNLLPNKVKPSLVFEINDQQQNNSKVTLSKEANISCYGVNAVGRGIIQTLNISEVNVDPIFITGLSAVKEGKDLYTFICYTNSSFNLTYEWFWNQVKITKDVSTAMQNGQSIGQLVYHGLKGKETGNLTCRATRNIYHISATIIKHISTDDFPVVELNTTSTLIKNGVSVEVACYLLPKYVNSTRVFFVDNQQRSEPKVKLSKDSHVSCYGINDVGRGEVEILNIYEETVITNLTAVKENKDKYIFTCYTNNTYNDLTYEWFWNEVPITKGLSQSMQNGKSQGKLEFGGLFGNETGNMTCRATRKAIKISSTMTKHISPDDFPVVELNATSTLIQNGLPVEVACYLLPKYVNSTLVFIVNNQRLNESKVKLSKDSTVSCYGENDVGQGDIKTLQISTAIVITDLTAVKERKDRYIFTCYTNNTYNDLTYEWFWNKVPITKGLSQSMLDGKSIGILDFDGLSGNETGNITCRAIRRRFNILDTMIKHINTEGFPVVELNPTSHIIKNEIPVEVACDLLPEYVNSTVVLTVNNQVINDSKVKLSREANVSCYGVNDVGRGEIKTLQIPEAIVFITDISMAKDRQNRYIFTCHTNSSFKYLEYEWHWNQFKVTRGLSTSMENDTSQGTFTSDGLREDETGNLTCRVKRKGSNKFATRITHIRTEDLPVVELKTTSYLIKKDISVVEVGCYLFPNYVNSTVVLIVNDRRQQTSKAKLSKEANVSCYGVNDAGRGGIETLQISMAIGKKTCPAVRSNNIDWLESIADSTAHASCPDGLFGVIKRPCSKDGRWQDQDNSSCIKMSIWEIGYTLSRIASIGGEYGNVMEQLANATRGELETQDISETIKVLGIASSIPDSRKTWTEKEDQGFVDVISNLMREDKWKILEKKKNLTAAYLLKKMDEFGRIAARRITGSLSLQAENLVVELRKVDVNTDIQFPVLNEYQPEWVNDSNTEVVVPSNILIPTFGENKSVFMNAVLFKNVNVMPNSRNESYSKNSLVLAISLGEKPVNLTGNISIIFKHLSQGYRDPSCNFWDFQKNPELGGSWSPQGCAVNFTNSTQTICSCDHLTDFILLMKPGVYIKKEGIQMITLVGCGISSFALLLTMVLYGICWKYVTSHDVNRSQSILLMNLCVSLIIGYMLFVTSAEETREEKLCKAIAALIHYFFLVSFFTMLAEGVDMAISLTVVFTSKITRLPWLFTLCWVAPAIIVGITLAATNTEGFGNERYCWLTWENHVRLAFIVPVLTIIAINTICVVAIMKALFSTHSMLRKNIKERLRTGVRAIGVLTPLLGFTWAFGIFASNEQMKAFEYIFSLANSSQGLFIFLAYCVFNKQVWNNVWKRGKTKSKTPVKPATNPYNKFVSSRNSTDLENLRRLPSVTGDHRRHRLQNDLNEDHSTNDNFEKSSGIEPKKDYDNYSFCEPALRYSYKGMKGPIDSSQIS